MVDNLSQSSWEMQKKEAKRNIDKYKKFRKTLLKIGEEAKQDEYARRYSGKTTFRPGLHRTESPGTRISPELVRLWPEIRRLRTAEECRRATEEFLERECRSITVPPQKPFGKFADEMGDDLFRNMWFATTENGIDIRPGLYNGDEPIAMTLGDDCVHGLLAGRTGSGKSNALHVLITALMYEYAPWELNINLADFKIVEMSKYGNTQYKLEDGKFMDVPAPHVCKIAATDSMEYVLSIMYDMYEKMDIRQKVFAALGIQKLSQYRKMFDVVLPREILIVDEFQQMYELATPRQADTINQLIKMITKLGRATGYHLLFASQSMSGTVRGDVLANFKLRMCLPAGEEISTMVLGNKAASELTGSKSRGYLIANAEGGAENYNLEFKVPLVAEANDKEHGDLEEILYHNAMLLKEVSEFHDAGVLGKVLSGKLRWGDKVTKDLDFYREDVIRPLLGEHDSFEADLTQFAANIRPLLAAESELENYLLLGDSCVYAKKPGKRTTLEYFPLKLGERKNIICLGDTAVQRAYLMRLLLMQYGKAETGKNYVVQSDPLVAASVEWPQSDRFQELPANALNASVIDNVRNRSVMQEFVQLPKTEQTEEMLQTIVFRKLDQSNAAERIAVYNKEAKQDRVPLIEWDGTMEGLRSAADAAGGEIAEVLLVRMYEDAKKRSGAFWQMYLKGLDEQQTFQFKRLLPITYWINGFHLLTSLAEEWAGKVNGVNMVDLLKRCSGMGIRFVLIGTRSGELPSVQLKNFGYWFLATNDENNFLKAGMQKPKELKEGVVYFRAINETLNRQKPGLYILMQDEKLVKMYSVTDTAETDVEQQMFQAI